MPNIFDEIADKAFLMVAIRKPNTTERPDINDMNEIDSAVAEMYGFAFRAGGGLESSVPQYSLGYLLPKGSTVRMNQQNIVDRIGECEYFDEEPFVTITPVKVSEEELERAEMVGTPPEEALSGLQDFRDDFEEEF